MNTLITEGDSAEEIPLADSRLLVEAAMTSTGGLEVPGAATGQTPDTG